MSSEVESSVGTSCFKVVREELQRCGLVFFFVFGGVCVLSKATVVFGMAMHSLGAARHNAADLAAVLANANTTLRNAGLLSALLQGSQQLPPMFIDAENVQSTAAAAAQRQNQAMGAEGKGQLSCSGSNETQIPVVDLSLLSDPAARAGLVASLAEACEKFGFFQVVNHGVDMGLIERCEAEAHKMFELPLDVKERVHRPPGTSFGYGANTWVNQTVMHWAESFHMQLHPTSNIRDFSGKLFSEGDPSKFRYLHPLLSIRTN